jgi:hypothetical protein
MNNTENVSVASIIPFWKYAVGPSSQHSPAIPFWLKTSAETFFQLVQKELPWSEVVMYKRRGWRGIEKIKRSTPKPTEKWHKKDPL